MNDNLPANLDTHDLDPFEVIGNETSSQSNIEGKLLRFTKHGEYKAGQELEKIATGTPMVVFMPSLKDGYVKWVDGQPTQHVVGYVKDNYAPPAREELGDTDENEWNELNGRPIDPWQKTFYVLMCDEAGDLYTFVTSSKGGRSAVGLLATTYGRRRKMKPNEIPVVELQTRSYDHPDYGETFVPVFKIIGWTNVPKTFTELSAAVKNDDGSDAPLIEYGQQTKVETKPALTKPVQRAPAKSQPKSNIRGRR